jgi:hypothetical protein
VGLRTGVVNGSGWLQDGNKLMGPVLRTMIRKTCGNYDHHHMSFRSDALNQGGIYMEASYTMKTMILPRLRLTTLHA